MWRTALLAPALVSAGPPPGSTVLNFRGNLVYDRSALTEGPDFNEGEGEDEGDEDEEALNEAEYDSSEAYFAHASTPWPRWVVGWNPYVVRRPCLGREKETVQLVHHMNIEVLLCKEGQACPTEFTAADDIRFVASYDRGAAEYVLPPGYGIPIPAHTAPRLEYHLLLPACWDFGAGPPPTETSGFDLYVTRTPPRKEAALFGFDTNQWMKPRRGWAEQVSVLSARELQPLLQPPRASVELLAVHLHTHNIYARKWFELRGSDGTARFRSTPERAGYGPAEQSMINLADKGWPKLTIELGDVITQHCDLDTNALERIVPAGTSWGYEMCAMLFLVGGEGVGSVNSMLGEGPDSYIVYGQTPPVQQPAQSVHEAAKTDYERARHPPADKLAVDAVILGMIALGVVAAVGANEVRRRWQHPPVDAAEETVALASVELGARPDIPELDGTLTSEKRKQIG